MKIAVETIVMIVTMIAKSLPTPEAPLRQVRDFTD
jgi:hypothetical protein